MANPVRLQLKVIDVYSKPIPETVDIILRHQVLNEERKARENGSKTIEITGLHGAPQGRSLTKRLKHQPSKTEIS